MQSNQTKMYLTTGATTLKKSIKKQIQREIFYRIQMLFPKNLAIYIHVKFKSA